MLSLAVENGVKFVQGRVTSLESTSGQVTRVRYIPVSDDTTSEEHTLEADCIILAAGAWSPTLLPSLPISATRAHSIVIKPPPTLPTDAISPYVLFTSIALPTSGRSREVTPEIYPRPDPAIYVCGPGDTRVALPPNVDDVDVDERACEEIWEWVAQTGVIKSEVIGEVEKRQACYLPIVESGGGPIIGNVPGVKGLVVAAGHTCWVGPSHSYCDTYAGAMVLSLLIFLLLLGHL